jgi:hypothetical protein
VQLSSKKQLDEMDVGVVGVLHGALTASTQRTKIRKTESQEHILAKKALKKRAIGFIL